MWVFVGVCGGSYKKQNLKVGGPSKCVHVDEGEAGEGMKWLYNK